MDENKDGQITQEEFIEVKKSNDKWWIYMKSFLFGAIYEPIHFNEENVSEQARSTGREDRRHQQRKGIKKRNLKITYLYGV